jgi:hypothetical protein
MEKSMTISNCMLNAITKVNEKDNISLILELDYKFEYGCAVEVSPLEDSYAGAKNSYRKLISINEEINILQEQLNQEKQRREDAEKCLEFYADNDTWSDNCYSTELGYVLSLDDEFSLNNYESSGGKRARAYFAKYKESK